MLVDTSEQGCQLEMLLGFDQTLSIPHVHNKVLILYLYNPVLKKLNTKKTLVGGSYLRQI